MKLMVRVFDGGDVISGPIFDGGDVLEASIQSAMSIAARYIIGVMGEADMLPLTPTTTGCLCELCGTERWLEEDGQKVFQVDASRPSVILFPPDEAPDKEACQIFQPIGENGLYIGEYHHKCLYHDVIVRWV